MDVQEFSPLGTFGLPGAPWEPRALHSIQKVVGFKVHLSPCMITDPLLVAFQD